MVSLGEQDKKSGEASNKLGNSYAAQLVYRKGAFASGFAYTYQSLASSMTGFYNFKDGSWHENLYNLGASYDFGATKLYGNLVYRQGGSNTSYNPNLIVYSTSLKTPLFGGNLLNGFAYLKNNSVKESDAWNISARYDYPLSKRTTVYAGAAYLHNEDNVNYTINGGGGTSSAPATNIGKSPWTAFVGLNHNF
jgi:predicted porin